jgi:tetratricopeptide (TPR) repeat protein
MKRIAFAALFCFATLTMFAQKQEVKNADKALSKGELDVALTSINLATQNPETQGLPDTWFLKGNILQTIGASQDEKYKSLVANPLVEAFECYKKVIELDAKNKFKNKLGMQFLSLSNSLVNAGGAFYEKQDYKNSLLSFETSLEVNKQPIFKGAIDTSIIYNAGYVALKDSSWDKAIKYFTETKNYNYNGVNSYILLKDAYLGKKDLVNAEAVLQECSQKYGNSNNAVVFELVNYYILTGQSEKALDYLRIAKEIDPKNVSLYFAEGTLYEKTNQPEKAIESYKKSVEIDSTYFDGYYNLGVVYYNKAVKYYEQSNSTKDYKEAAKIQALGDVELKNSLPWMEKAHQVNPNDKDCMMSLKNLYIRMQSIDSENYTKWEQKFKAVKAQLDAAN